MFTLNIHGHLHTFTEPVVMGILNATPDSFYESSRSQEMDKILLKTEKMIQDGMTILDIGGQSTRPGADFVEEQEEMRRVLPILKELKKNFKELIISVDTFSSIVAEQAITLGADIINDVSSGQRDQKMLQVVGKYKVPYVGMHMRGNPKTMHSLTNYTDLGIDILQAFSHTIKACKEAGIHDIILDPGFGFAKKSAQNFRLLQELHYYKMAGFPLLVGVSRKRTIWETLGITTNEALNGTTVLNTVALYNGADILRVHDVKEAKEAITLMTAYKNAI